MLILFYFNYSQYLTKLLQIYIYRCRFKVSNAGIHIGIDGDRVDNDKRIGFKLKVVFL